MAASSAESTQYARFCRCSTTRPNTRTNAPIGAVPALDTLFRSSHMESGGIPPHLISPYIGCNAPKLEAWPCLFTQYTMTPKTRIRNLRNDQTRLVQNPCRMTIPRKEKCLWNRVGWKTCLANVKLNQKEHLPCIQCDSHAICWFSPSFSHAFRGVQLPAHPP